MKQKVKEDAEDKVLMEEAIGELEFKLERSKEDNKASELLVDALSDKNKELEAINDRLKENMTVLEEDSEPEPVSRPTGTAPGQLETLTIADIYAAQGLTVPALEIYRKHLAARPDDEVVAEKIRSLESRIEGEGDETEGE